MRRAWMRENVGIQHYRMTTRVFYKYEVLLQLEIRLVDIVCQQYKLPFCRGTVIAPSVVLFVSRHFI